jgi:hypothetical protein
MPLPAGRHEHRTRRCFLRLIVADYQQASAEHVDGLVECVVRMRNRPGEVRWDGDLHRSETRRLPVLAGKDVHWLAGVAEPRSITPVCQQRYGLYLPTWPGANLLPVAAADSCPRPASSEQSTSTHMHAAERAASPVISHRGSGTRPCLRGSHRAFSLKSPQRSAADEAVTVM